MLIYACKQHLHLPSVDSVQQCCAADDAFKQGARKKQKATDFKESTATEHWLQQKQQQRIRQLSVNQKYEWHFSFPCVQALLPTVSVCVCLLGLITVSRGSPLAGVIYYYRNCSKQTEHQRLIALRGLNNVEQRSTRHQQHNWVLVCLHLTAFIQTFAWAFSDSTVEYCTVGIPVVVPRNALTKHAMKSALESITSLWLPTTQSVCTHLWSSEHHHTSSTPSVSVV